jgi:uncharacterized membrane protein YgcG
MGVTPEALPRALTSAAMLKRVLACTAIVMGSIGLGAPPAGAQYGEQIKSYVVDITVQQNGSLSIVETIDYDFGSNQHHGIDRDIPVRFHYDNRNDRVYPLHVTSVTASPGTPSQYKTSSVSDGETRIRIGDPNQTIDGEHTYTIKYTVDRALNGFSDHDELYWNATGNSWPVPIQHATAHVHTPAAITKVACFAGPLHSSLNCDNATSTGSDATFTQEQLDSDAGVTVVVAMPHGVVPAPKPLLEERWSFDRAFSRTPTTLGVAGGLIGLCVAFILWLLWRVGRDRQTVGGGVEAAFTKGDGPEERTPLLHHTETPVEFEPPEGIRPGEIGTLVDETVNPLDVTATIVDLAVRGYLTIEEVEQHHWFGKPDWKLSILKSADGLQDFERELLQGIAAVGNPVLLSQLNRQFASRYATVQSLLYADAVKTGWFARSPSKTRSHWNALGLLVVVAGAAITFALAKWTHLGLIGIPIVVAGLMFMTVAHRMPHRTAKGTGMLRRVEGFKRFIESPTESDHAKFDERKNLFSEYLPYAIVFGCTEKWAKAFASLGEQATDTTGWYVSNRPFEYVAFSHAMNSFTTTTSGTVAAATPSSSGGSGFGGGGFSGGGGGGGGGGSW